MQRPWYKVLLKGHMEDFRVTCSKGIGHIKIVIGLCKNNTLVSLYHLLCGRKSSNSNSFLKLRSTQKED